MGYLRRSASTNSLFYNRQRIHKAISHNTHLLFLFASHLEILVMYRKYDFSSTYY